MWLPVAVSSPSMSAATIIVSVVLAIITVIHSPFLVTRHVFPSVPVVSHKIDLFTARIVFTAVFFPVLGMAGRDAQIDGWVPDRHSLNDHRLRIEKRGPGKTANINLSIEAGLADGHRHSDISRVHRCANGANYGYGNQEFFHGLVSIIKAVRI